MIKAPKTKHKKRGPKHGSKHSSKHNSAISEGLKKYWATAGRKRKTKKVRKSAGRRHVAPKVEHKPRRKPRYFQKKH